MKLASLTPCALALMVALTGCSDPKAASNDNFSKAINAYFEANPACLYVTNKTLPLKVWSGPHSYDMNVHSLPQLDALAKVGLLTVTETQEASGSGLMKANRTYRTYALTDKGQKSYATWGKQNKGFCYGQLEVVDVTNFTEPSPLMGVTVSQVNYSFRVKEAADWSQDPAVKAAYGKEVVPQGETVKGTTIMVKTGEGWVHQRMLDKS
ncbi:ubiquitin-associated-like domain-containing protein [Pseudogulbenkiania sp. MAI-1]|uniref:ubiquitin-associated-like domain-containing protein n=1 Tax=Pseudogulbenkiania sp. MAI-1 TaxID=990370 RepID=UPI00045EB675|nr:ubiquitin-associated-like domain-containing protein [Pseudogulbenkiania sp. MAI-1]